MQERRRVKRSSLPAVDLWALVGAASHNLRGGVQRTAAEGVQQVLPVEYVGEAEICDFGAAVLVQEDVLQLQVSVANVVLHRKRRISTMQISCRQYTYSPVT